MYVGLYSNPLGYSAYQNADWQAAWAASGTDGFTIAHNIFDWNVIEYGFMAYDTSPISNFVSWTGSLPLSINFGIIDNGGQLQIPTGYLPAPPNAFTSPWQSKLVIQRFKTFLRKTLPLFGSRAYVISIGNEIDSYLNNHTNEIAGFAEFFGIMYNAIKAYNKDILVTTTFTSNAQNLISNAAVWLPISSQCDAVQYTYYPINSDFSVKSTGVIAGDLTGLATSAVSIGKKILFQELGYPSGGTYIGSSENTQNTAYTQYAGILSALKNTYALSANFTFRNEFPDNITQQSIAASLKAGITPSNRPNFYEFLQSLGVIRATGVAKAAYTTLVSNIATMT